MTTLNSTESLNNITLSYVFSVLSIIFYTILTFPQIYTIFKLKTSVGFSLLSGLLWCSADVINLTSVVLLNLETNLIFIGWYHLTMSYILVSFGLYYNNSESSLNKTRYIYMMSLGFIIVFSVNVISIFYKFHVFVFGTMLAWLSVFMYIGGRIPQIYKNYISKTTFGLSPYMFVFTTFGNLFYGLSILVLSTQREYILLNLPWLVLIVLCTFCDFFIILQCVYYKQKRFDLRINTVELDSRITNDFA